MKSVIFAVVFLLTGFALGGFFRPATVRAADPASNSVGVREVGSIKKVHIGRGAADDVSTVWVDIEQKPMTVIGISCVPDDGAAICYVLTKKVGGNHEAILKSK